MKNRQHFIIRYLSYAVTSLFCSEAEKVFFSSQKRERGRNTEAAEAAEKRAKDHGLAREVIGQAAQMVRDLVGVAEQAGVFLQNTPSEAGKTAAAASAQSVRR